MPGVSEGKTCSEESYQTTSSRKPLEFRSIKPILEIVEKLNAYLTQLHFRKSTIHNSKKIGEKNNYSIILYQILMVPKISHEID